MADVPDIVGLEDVAGMGYPTSSSRRASISQPCHGTELVYIYIQLYISNVIVNAELPIIIYQLC